LREATFLLFAAMIEWGQQHDLQAISRICEWSESCAGPAGASIASANLARSEPPKPSLGCCRSPMMLSEQSGRQGTFLDPPSKLRRLSPSLPKRKRRFIPDRRLKNGSRRIRYPC
jgi:hypothetical protein